MKRSVIKLAGKTLVVSLPAKWAREHGIRKGDELDVEAESKKLTISPFSAEKTQKTTIILHADEELARRQINIAYKQGHDEVELVFEQPKVMRAVEKELSQLIGFEIIHRSSSRAVIKNIASPQEEEFENVLRRVFLVLLEMYEGAVEKMKEGQNLQLAELADLEKTNDKLTNFCKRIINKHRLENATSLYLLCARLEQLADVCAEFFKASFKLKTMPKQILNYFVESSEVLRLLYQLYYSKKISQAQELLDLLKILKEKRKSLQCDAKSLHSVSSLLAMADILEETSWICIAKTV